MAITTTYSHDTATSSDNRAGRRTSVSLVDASSHVDESSCPSCMTCCASARVACGGEPQYTLCEIRRHQSPQSAWLVAGGYVYDATDYIKMHPGGETSILKKCGGGCDCTQDLLFHSVKGQQLWKKYKIGKVRPCCSSPEDKTWWMFWKK